MKVKDVIKEINELNYDIDNLETALHFKYSKENENKLEHKKKMVKYYMDYEVVE